MGSELGTLLVVVTASILAGFASLSAVVCFYTALFTVTSENTKRLSATVRGRQGLLWVGFSVVFSVLAGSLSAVAWFFAH